MSEDAGPYQVATLRLVNESAIHDHALECSRKFRAGRFTRVGQDFIDEVKADVAVMVRTIRAQYSTHMHEPLETDLTFTTGELMNRFQPEINRAIGRLIQNKVQRQPSVGKTLGRTR